MKIIDTKIKDVKIIEPAIFGDERGFFMETWQQKKFDEQVCPQVFVQDNHSQSEHGVLRGLHYQVGNDAQGKLVRCVEGEVFDVAVDIRHSSPTFGEWVGVILSAENKKQLWIPAGFAHGFLTISESAQFLYKTTNYYSPKAERCILWDDKDIGVEWPQVKKIQLSDKDLKGFNLNSAELYC
ncbi:dTDP-4-dehydrorhamnose 3,5-epimerase [Pantoea agglomerans]|uniref:dTDP-4-dehydrorhamnose 3,5-epimerase n=1 Tax=Enterobacter agglomerans TaxID=549 RepID=UPI001653FCDF|nr:dTDP-4-dehydrorhamnose 3,5-epimerase [Pantoea agglomerans]